MVSAAVATETTPAFVLEGNVKHFEELGRTARRDAEKALRQAAEADAKVAEFNRALATLRGETP